MLPTFSTIMAAFYHFRGLLINKNEMKITSYCIINLMNSFYSIRTLACRVTALLGYLDLAVCNTEPSHVIILQMAQFPYQRVIG